MLGLRLIHVNKRGHWSELYLHFYINLISLDHLVKTSQIAWIVGPTWGPLGTWWPQVGPKLVPWILLSEFLNKLNMDPLWHSLWYMRYIAYSPEMTTARFGSYFVLTTETTYLISLVRFGVSFVSICWKINNDTMALYCNTVGCHYGAVQYYKIFQTALHGQTYNINQKVKS